jgi:DNA-directed RNA polymerase sigma subunit (sigma70/sigma32)
MKTIEHQIEVWRMQAAGMTYEAIGKKFGYNRERARQIAMKGGRILFNMEAKRMRNAQD